MDNGIKLEFDNKGNWTEIDCKPKAVPSALVPTAIQNYISKQFNGTQVIQIERTGKGYEVSMECDGAGLPEGTQLVAEEIGKTPVQVNEAAGFVVNRILIPMINEAAFIKMEGVSDIAGIDAAMKLGANHPMGPLELGDFIGLDICLAIMDVLYNETGDSKYRACPLLRKMVRGGNLGCKSGKGFYVYNADRTKTPVDAM